MARLADERRATGEDQPLLGIPLGIKDVIITQGVPTTAGSKILENLFLPSIPRLPTNSAPLEPFLLAKPIWMNLPWVLDRVLRLPGNQKSLEFEPGAGRQ